MEINFYKIDILIPFLFKDYLTKRTMNLRTACFHFRYEILCIGLIGSTISFALSGLIYYFLTRLFPISSWGAILCSTIIPFLVMGCVVYARLHDMRRYYTDPEEVEFIQRFIHNYNQVLFVVYYTLFITATILFFSLIYSLLVFLILKIESDGLRYTTLSIFSLLSLYLITRLLWMYIHHHTQPNYIFRQYTHSILQYYHSFELMMCFSTLYLICFLFFCGMLFGALLIQIQVVMFVILAFGYKNNYFELKTTIICGCVLLVLDAIALKLYHRYKERQRERNRVEGGEPIVQQEHPPLQENNEERNRSEGFLTQQRNHMVSDILERRLHNIYIRGNEPMTQTITIEGHRQRMVLPCSCRIVTLEEPVMCPICLSNIKNAGLKTWCRHMFCKDCIVEWLKYQDTCPTCRANLIYNSPI